MVMCIAQDNWARDLRGGAVSGMGGASYAMGTGFLSKDNIKNNYGFGVSVEYFFLKTLSGGLSSVHNSFRGYWNESHYHFGNYHYSTDWNWTNVSIFGRFVLGPEDKLSPYLKGGVGLYIPRTKDRWYYHPDTTYTHTSYGKGQFGWYFGMGIQYLVNKQVLVHLDVPLIAIHTKGLVIHWIDIPQRMEQYHKIYEKSYYFNIFAGISFILGTKKEET
jgi:outer membrane protein W